MKAIIVAAGRGTRLVPHTNHLPKCLLPFAGARLFDWQRAAFAANAITDITVVRGFMGELFNSLDVTLRDNPRWQDTNMVYSLFCARDILESGESIIVSYGDIVYEPRVIQTLLECKDDICVVVDRNWQELWQRRFDNPLDDAESLRMSADGKIIDIGRKVSTLDEIEAQYIGLMKFSTKGAAQLCAFHDLAREDATWLADRSLENCYMTDLLRGLHEAGTPLTATVIDGGWLEFDTVNDLELFNLLHDKNGLTSLFDTSSGADI